MVHQRLASVSEFDNDPLVALDLASGCFDVQRVRRLRALVLGADHQGFGVGVQGHSAKAALGCHRRTSVVRGQSVGHVPTVRAVVAEVGGVDRLGHQLVRCVKSLSEATVIWLDLEGRCIADLELEQPGLLSQTLGPGLHTNSGLGPWALNRQDQPISWSSLMRQDVQQRWLHDLGQTVGLQERVVVDDALA